MDVMAKRRPSKRGGQMAYLGDWDRRQSKGWASKSTFSLTHRLMPYRGRLVESDGILSLLCLPTSCSLS